MSSISWSQLLQLRPLLGRHRVHHRLHGRHALRHLLQQLVEVLRVLREEVAELLHELLERLLLVVGVGARLTLLDEVVERRHHVLHAGHVLGGHVLHAGRHLVDHLLHQLLLELLHQLLEALLRLLALEVVGAEFAHLAGQVVGQHVEAEVALRGSVLRCGGAPLVAAALGCLRGLLDGVALFVDDVVELRWRSRRTPLRGRTGRASPDAAGAASPSARADPAPGRRCGHACPPASSAAAPR
jgi:hypothetical protein